MNFSTVPMRLEQVLKSLVSTKSLCQRGDQHLYLYLFTGRCHCDAHTFIKLFSKEEKFFFSYYNVQAKIRLVAIYATIKSQCDQHRGASTRLTFRKHCPCGFWSLTAKRQCTLQIVDLHLAWMTTIHNSKIFVGQYMDPKNHPYQLINVMLLISPI